jgi:diguanylate cyclase
MLFKSRQPATPAAPPIERDADNAGSDGSLDALGAVLQALGDNALPIDNLTSEQIHDGFERWRRHLLVGAAHPVDPEHRERDFSGARRFATNYRRQEITFHKRVGKELRDVLWTLISQVSTTLAADSADVSQTEKQLTTLKSALASGNVDALRSAATATLDIFSSSMHRRRQRTDEQLGQLREHISAMRDELEQARQALQIDPLTRLYNRGAFDAHIVRVAELASLVAEPTAMFFIDIDFFKKVNDVHGHQTGDLVLRQVADACVRCFPRQRDFVARYGGEEIVAIAHDVDASQLPMLTQRVLKAVRSIQTASIRGEPINVTVSVGAAMLDPGESTQQWIERADKALYRAKATGRDRGIIDGHPDDKPVL